MKYKTEKILLTILSLEIIAIIFITCFYYDLFQSTANGRYKINEYGQMDFTPVPSWSVTIQNNLKDIFNYDV